jgi:methionine-rich copper-binding protein CopC
MKLNRVLTASGTALLALLLTSLAWGHATARNSTPKNGAILSEPPTQIVIQFGNAAKLVSLVVASDDGSRVEVDVSNATSVDGVVGVAVEPLAPGKYRVIWRAMGIDGHITAGDFGFEVSAPQ